MSTTIVIITESEVVARAMAKSLAAVLGNSVETISMTYRQSRMSRDLLLRTDLFILDVISSDRVGPRAEGIPVAESFAEAGRKALLISGGAKADLIASEYYWDVAAEDHLAARVQRVLDLPPPSPKDFDALRLAFAPYCRPPHDGHHH